MWFLINLLGTPDQVSKALAALTFELACPRATPVFPALPAGLTAQQIADAQAQHKAALDEWIAEAAIARAFFDRTKKYIASELPLYPKDANVGVTARYHEQVPGHGFGARGSMESIVSISEHP